MGRQQEVWRSPCGAQHPVSPVQPGGRTGLTRGGSVAVMEEMGTGSTLGGEGGRVTQRVNCCSGNRLWQEPPAGGSGLFAAWPKVLRLTMSVEGQERGGGEGRRRRPFPPPPPPSMMATEVKSLMGKTQQSAADEWSSRERC